MQAVLADRVLQLLWDLVMDGNAPLEVIKCGVLQEVCANSSLDAWGCWCIHVHIHILQACVQCLNAEILHVNEAWQGSMSMKHCNEAWQ